MKIFKKAKYIHRGNVLLLIRWNIFECKYFSIKIHKLLNSDDQCQHDHPWAFLTFLMKGGYVEHNMRRTRKTEYFKYGSKVYGRFSLLYRPANYVHRLEIHQPVWTLVITFKKVRTWGFETPSGWIPFYKYDHKTDCI